MGITELITKFKNNRRMLLLIVFIALLLDYMLLSAIIPILPDYLLRQSHPNSMNFSALNNQSEDTAETLSKEMKESRHKTFTEENVYIGFLFSASAFMQMFTDLWTGSITNKIGYTVPMFTGFCIMFISALMFAFGSSYFMLLFARALQGVGLAFASTAGLGMLAQAYPDDAERGSAIGIAFSGLALGAMAGPTFGGTLYQWSGKALPFIILALLCLFDGSLQLIFLQLRVIRSEPVESSFKELLKDPYIMITAGALTVGNLSISMLEASLPLWMIDTWQARPLEQGVAFLPESIFYLVGTNIFGPLADRIGRWLSGCLGLIIIGVSMLSIPIATSTSGLIAPFMFMGFAIGMIDSSMYPQMGYLADLRHAGNYGSVYAIANIAACLAYALGPFISGPLVHSLGFPVMTRISAGIIFLYVPLLYFLRNQPAVLREERQLLTSSQRQYQTFVNAIKFKE